MFNSNGFDIPLILQIISANITSPYASSAIRSGLAIYSSVTSKILYENLSKEEAEQKEIELIAYYKSNQSKFGYNIANGGHIHSVSEETKKKLSQSLKGKHNSPKTEFKKGHIS